VVKEISKIAFSSVHVKL